jgi:hypothetical protein
MRLAGSSAELDLRDYVSESMSALTPVKDTSRLCPSSLGLAMARDEGRES